MANKGLSTSEIAKQLCRERSNIAVYLFKIKRPEKGNQLGNTLKKRDRKPVSLEEAYAHKIASLLRLPLNHRTVRRASASDRQRSGARRVLADGEIKVVPDARGMRRAY